MFVFQKNLILTVVITFGAIKSDLVPIDWNFSADRKQFHFEREYKYPMFNEVAPVPCDLTDSCDIFCCRDSDCNETQRQSFRCDDDKNACDETLARFHCGCDYFDKPEWFPFLCYAYKNPVYLGKFYTTLPKITSFSKFKSSVGRSFSYRSKSKPLKLNELKYGSPIMTFVPSSENPSISPLLGKANVKGSACISSPVKYGINNSVACLTMINQELCENSHTLSIIPHLLGFNNTPVVLKKLDFLKGVETEVVMKRVKTKLKTKRWKNKHLGILQLEAGELCSDCMSDFKTVWRAGTCHNVLAYVQHEFVVNGSEIVKLKVEYGLMNVSFPHDKSQKSLYLKQIFNITFFDIMININVNESSLVNDELFNRGYFVGEILNFGYKRFRNSTTVWERGKLGVFSNVGSCDASTPVTFGYDAFSYCIFREDFSNCKQFTDAVEGKLDDLIKGEALASYSHLRDPYNQSVPVLRSYGKSAEGNSTGCRSPVRQDVIIQYTSVITRSGDPVYRIVGMRVDRSFRNSTPTADLKLISQVVFLHVSFPPTKPASRFWAEVFSPELSENAWVNMLNGFGDVSPEELAEITFWGVVFVVALLAMAGLAKLNFHLDIWVTIFNYLSSYTADSFLFFIYKGISFLKKLKYKEMKQKKKKKRMSGGRR